MEISREPLWRRVDRSTPCKPWAMFEISNADWNLYLRGHRHPTNRLLHVAGWLLLFGCLAAAVSLRSWHMLGAGIAGAYALAWVGHFVFERNTPETFRRPLFSALASLRLFTKIVGRRFLRR